MCYNNFRNCLIKYKWFLNYINIKTKTLKLFKRIWLTMKRSKFDLIISTLITISLICFLFFLLDRSSTNILNLGIIIFLFSSILIIIYLIKNITLKKQSKIIKYKLPFENCIETINENLINDGFVLGIDEIKENLRIKHYKKEFNKNSMYMISIISCNNLNDKLNKIINSSIINQCKKDKHENVKYLYSIKIIIVDKTNSCLMNNLDIEFENNKTTLTTCISLEENNLYLMEKDAKENIIKDHTAKEKLFEILNLKGSEEQWKKKN